MVFEKVAGNFFINFSKYLAIFGPNTAASFGDQVSEYTQPLFYSVARYYTFSFFATRSLRPGMPIIKVEGITLHASCGGGMAARLGVVVWVVAHTRANKKLFGQTSAIYPQHTVLFLDS